jgi:transposase-like protein
MLRHQFPSSVIQHAVWLYLRFNLSLREVEDLLAERGLDISDETVRRWVVKFGTAYARNLRRRRPTPHSRWYLDEMFVSIGGRRMIGATPVRSAGRDGCVRPLCRTVFLHFGTRFFP